MKDLNYGGDEPAWEKMDILDRVAEPGESSEKVAKHELDRLKKEKRELASELQRTQDLLRQQVEIDKENNELVLLEIKQLKATVEKDKMV